MTAGQSSPKTAIVKVDKRPYRKIAQENWGLTDQQMEGMHVHHRIRQADGGRNDPSNLFVCSPSFHSGAWHGEIGGFIGAAQEAGRKGGAIQGQRNKESGQWDKCREKGTVAAAENGKHLLKNKPPRRKKLTRKEVGKVTAERNKSPEMRKSVSDLRRKEAERGEHPAQRRLCCLHCKKETNQTSLTRFHKNCVA